MKYYFQIMLCIFSVFLASAAGCAGGGAESGAMTASDEVNYPEVWERVLPEAVQTNIANYTVYDLYPWEKEHTNLADYAVSVYWVLDEAYHVEGEEYDDVVLRFSPSRGGNSRYRYKLYYSFFNGHLLSKDGKNKLSLASNIFDVLPDNVSVQTLPFIDKNFNKFSNELHYLNHRRYIFPPKVTLSNSIIYDQSYRNTEGNGWSCRDPIELSPYEFSLLRGVHFLPAEYREEDTSREDSWFLVQGLKQPRWITTKCGWGAGSLNPVHIYRYREFSFLRVDDNIVHLRDGTFLFIGTGGEFPTFYIPRLKSDMSIPASIDTRYKWIPYKDLLSIIDSIEDIIHRYRSCPFIKGFDPYCISMAEDGTCSQIEGNFIHYDNFSTAPISFDGLSVDSQGGMNSCLNLGLREYVRENLEIYHCQDGDKVNPSTVPCNEREK